MKNIELTNFNQSNIDAVDSFLANDDGLAYLQTTYTMVQTNSYNSVTITEESREKCVKSLVR